MLRKYTNGNNSLLQCCSPVLTASTDRSLASDQPSRSKLSLKHHQYKRKTVKRQNTMPDFRQDERKLLMQNYIKNDKPAINFSYNVHLSETKILQQNKKERTVPLKIIYKDRKSLNQDNYLQNNSQPSSATSIQLTSQNINKNYQENKKNNLDKNSTSAFLSMNMKQKEQQNTFQLFRLKSCSESESSAFIINQYQHQDPESIEQKHSIKIGQEAFGELDEIQMQIAKLQSQINLKKESQVPTATNDSVKVSQKYLTSRKLSNSDHAKPSIFKKGTLFLKVRRAQTVSTSLEQMSPTLKTSKVLENHESLLAKLRSEDKGFGMLKRL